MEPEKCTYKFGSCAWYCVQAIKSMDDTLTIKSKSVQIRLLQEPFKCDFNLTTIRAALDRLAKDKFLVHESVNIYGENIYLKGLNNGRKKTKI